MLEDFVFDYFGIFFALWPIDLCGGALLPEVVAPVVQCGLSRFIVEFCAEISLGNKGGCCPFCSAVFSTSLSASWGLPTFVDSVSLTLDWRGGSWDRPDPPASWALQPMLTRGHSHPCELGTYTHAFAFVAFAF